MYEAYSKSFHTYALDLWSAFGGETDENWLRKPRVGPYKFKIYPWDTYQIGPFHSIEDAYTSDFNAATIKKLEIDLDNCAYCNSSQFPDSLSAAEINTEISKRNEMIERVQRMTKSIKKEHPFIFLESRLRPILLFFTHDLRGTTLVWSNDIFEDRNKLDTAMKHVFNFGYSLLLVGLIGLFILFFKVKVFYKPIILAGLASTFVYPLIFGMPEWRYIYGAIPILVIGVAYVWVSIESSIKKLLKTKKGTQ